MPPAPLRRALLWVVFGLLAGNLVAVGVRAATQETSAAASVPTTTVVDAPVVARPPAAPTSTFPSVVLPVPQAPPADPYADEPKIELGRLQIPKLGLDTTFYDGVSLTSIDRGPSHWPGTAMPGQLGNVVLAGHRVTHTRPFRNLDRLGPGDTATFTTADGTFTYEYVSTEIVDPTRTDIVAQTPARTATFFACHPPGSARSRIVVHWRMVGDPGVPPGTGVIGVTSG